MIVDWVWANNSLWIVFSSRSVDLQDFKVGMMIAHYTLHYTRLTKWKPLKHLPYAALAEFPHYLFFQYSSPFTLHSCYKTDPRLVGWRMAAGPLPVHPEKAFLLSYLYCVTLHQDHSEWAWVGYDIVHYVIYNIMKKWLDAKWDGCLGHKVLW